MEDLTERLRQAQLLERVPADTLRRIILPRGKLTEYGKGGCVISAQDKVTAVQVILSGRVNILYLFADGSYSLAATETALRILALDLIATRTKISPYYAVATEPTAIFSFPAALILEPGALPEPERLALLDQLLLMLSQLHMRTEYRMAILSRNGLRERIVVYLSMQAARRRSSSCTVPFSREEMAAFLCVNRSALSHELSLMKKEGLIDFRKNHFTLLGLNAAPPAHGDGEP